MAESHGLQILSASCNGACSLHSLLCPGLGPPWILYLFSFFCHSLIFPQFYLYGPSKAMWFRQGVLQPQVQGISFDWSKLAMVACMPFATEQEHTIQTLIHWVHQQRSHSTLRFLVGGHNYFVKPNWSFLLLAVENILNGTSLMRLYSWFYLILVSHYFQLSHCTLPISTWKQNTSSSKPSIL